MTRQQRYKKRKPWVRYVLWSKQRCRAPEGSKWWPFYGAKGLEHTLTVAQAEILWNRDNAAVMQKPSLDRIDPSKGYTLENCRFREWMENVRDPHTGTSLEFCFLNG